MNIKLRIGKDKRVRWSAYDDEEKFLFASNPRSWEHEFEALADAERCRASSVHARIYSTTGEWVS